MAKTLTPLRSSRAGSFHVQQAVAKCVTRRTVSSLSLPVVIDLPAIWNLVP